MVFKNGSFQISNFISVSVLKNPLVTLILQDVKIYAVQCENNSKANNFYQTIASQTFGHHVSLADIKQIEKVLMDICYREKMLLKVHSLTMSGRIFIKRWN